MEDAGEDFIEETWTEIDENKKGSVTKEDMMNYLQTVWDLKN